jgi:cytochrome P450
MADRLAEDVSFAGEDPRACTDRLRPDHPVVRGDHGDYVLLRHADVRAAALDDVTFSSAVSAHLQIPNGLDGDAHRDVRAALDPFLSEQALAPLVPELGEVARALVEALPAGVAPVDAVTEIGTVFAVRAQSAWLGWPATLEEPLVAWVSANHEASRRGERTELAGVAARFDALITPLLAARRDEFAAVVGDDVTARLMRTQVRGRPFSDEEIVSVLRNWTGGDLGSIALCVGVLVRGLVTDDALQRRLRAGVSDEEWDAVIDELLRRDDPFVSNRRVATCPVTVGGVDIPEGARVTLHWTSANRDEEAFDDPDGFHPASYGPANLVYGVGRHACPGRALATIELRVALRALVAGTTWIAAADEPPVREVYPVGGWARVPVVLA